MINDALRLLRNFHNYRSRELAEMLGISPSYLSEIENGKKQPSLELLGRYSQVFKVKPSTILFFSEEIDRSNFKGRLKDNSRNLMLIFMKAIERFGELENDDKELSD